MHLTKTLTEINLEKIKQQTKIVYITSIIFIVSLFIPKALSCILFNFSITSIKSSCYIYCGKTIVIEFYYKIS